MEHGQSQLFMYWLWLYSHYHDMVKHEGHQALKHLLSYLLQNRFVYPCSRLITCLLSLNIQEHRDIYMIQSLKSTLLQNSICILFFDSPRPFIFLSPDDSFHPPPRMKWTENNGRTNEKNFINPELTIQMGKQVATGE